jgi:ADP-dependent phosphofructokinase/glucokinase
LSLDFSRVQKNVSVVNTNKNIRIPQEKRFFTSRDPANNKCSYLPEQSF